MHALSSLEQAVGVGSHGWLRQCQSSPRSQDSADRHCSVALESGLCSPTYCM